MTTKTIAVLLSLCILLASCGRDQKILDLEKREKEKAAQSVKEHIDELEGKVAGYEQQLSDYQNQHISRETEPCDCGKNTECSCPPPDTSQGKAGRWGKWDNPYFSLDTWFHPSKWDIREYLTIAGVAVAVIVVSGIVYYVYKNRIYTREREMELKREIEREKKAKEAAEAQNEALKTQLEEKELIHHSNIAVIDSLDEDKADDELTLKRMDKQLKKSLNEHKITKEQLAQTEEEFAQYKAKVEKSLEVDPEYREKREKLYSDIEESVQKLRDKFQQRSNEEVVEISETPISNNAEGVDIADSLQNILEDHEHAQEQSVLDLARKEEENRQLRIKLQQRSNEEVVERSEPPHSYVDADANTEAYAIPTDGSEQTIEQLKYELEQSDKAKNIAEAKARAAEIERDTEWEAHNYDREISDFKIENLRAGAIRTIDGQNVRLAISGQRITYLVAEQQRLIGGVEHFKEENAKKDVIIAQLTTEKDANAAAFAQEMGKKSKKKPPIDPEEVLRQSKEDTAKILEQYPMSVTANPDGENPTPSKKGGKGEKK